METNNTLLLVIFILIFVGIFGYVIFAKIKRRNTSWTGTVIDKNVTETASSSTNAQRNQSNSGIMFGGNRNAINRNYTLRIKDDVGKEFKWPVGDGFYESVQVGDRLSKQPGTETPVKISNTNTI